LEEGAGRYSELPVERGFNEMVLPHERSEARAEDAIPGSVVDVMDNANNTGCCRDLVDQTAADGLRSGYDQDQQLAGFPSSAENQMA